MLDISAENTWEEFHGDDYQHDEHSQRAFFIFGTFTATVEVQISFDQGVTWNTIESGSYTTAPISQTLNLTGAYRLRIGIATGNYTSGTASVQLS